MKARGEVVLFRNKQESLVRWSLPQASCLHWSQESAQECAPDVKWDPKLFPPPLPGD